MTRPPTQKTVREICLVCKGERWLPVPGDPSRSRPCPWCDQLGWVTVSPASLGEGPEGQAKPPRRPRRKES